MCVCARDTVKFSRSSKFNFIYFSKRNNVKKSFYTFYLYFISLLILLIKKSFEYNHRDRDPFCTTTTLFHFPQGCIDAYGSWHVVVLHSHHDIIVHCQSRCFSDRWENGIADWERRGSRQTDKDQVWSAWRR